MTFEEKYASIQLLVKNELEKINSELTSEINLSDSLNQSLKDFLLNRPKKIRPTVALLYLRAVGETIDTRQLTFQTAIELIHNASLIHDDVIDESDVRRGTNTLNSKFNNKLAILSGDYLLSIALRKINDLNNPEIIRLCAETLDGMCKGEVNQYFNRFKITSIDDYLQKTEQKTAKLFQTAVEGAMIIAKGKNIQQAKDFSLALGTAFQIRDDILNITANDHSKPSQNDTTNGIYNAPVIFAENISDLTKGIEKTKVLLNNYIIKAENSMKNLGDNEYKSAIRELLGLLKNE